MNGVRKEIGSEFWEVPTAAVPNHLFPDDTRWFLSGRSALSYIIADIQARGPVRRVAMPAWCCDSMVVPFIRAGIEVRFYPVYTENGRFYQDLSGIEGCELLFRMDYFGYAAGENRADFDGVSIHDLTHGLFSSPRDRSSYSFGSLRKWAGFYTGGYGWGFPGQPTDTDAAYVAMRQQAMRQKAAYIGGDTEDKAYLALFGEAEELLERFPVAGAADADVAKAAVLDVAEMRCRRRENAACLLAHFADIALFPELGPADCPLFVPVMVPPERRDALRRHLIENEMYCPVHWPLADCHAPDDKTRAIYQSELSLVCDQRYTPEDMERLAQTVKTFWKG